MATSSADKGGSRTRQSPRSGITSNYFRLVLTIINTEITISNKFICIFAIKIESMKHYLFLSFVILGFLCSCSNDDNNESKSNNKNRVVTITEYEWKFGEKATYGDLYAKYTYNEKNLLVKKETHYYNPVVGRIPDYYTYTYDENNHLVESTVSGLSWYKYKYTSNSIDSIASMEEYNKDGKLSEKWVYTYNSNRKLAQAEQTAGYGIYYKDDYSYEGNNIKVVRHRTDNGELFGTTHFEYDSHNNLLKKTWINGDTGKKDVETWNEYSYDSNGSILKKTIHGYLDKSELKYEDYTYNTDGTIKSIHISYSYKDDQSDLDYTYTFE